MPSETELKITEIPLNVTFAAYEKFLKKTFVGTGNLLKNVGSSCTEQAIDFRLIFHEEKKLEDLIKNNLIETKFKLIYNKITLNNMVMFGPDHKIKKYEDERKIIDDFCKERLALYEKRKAKEIEDMMMKLLELTNKARFIQMVNNNEQIKVRNVKKANVIKQLEDFKFDKKFKKKKDKEGKEEKDEGEEKEEEEDEQEDKNGYNYLTDMKIQSLTMELAAKYMKQKELKEQQIEQMRKKDVKEIWKEEIQKLEVELDRYVREMHRKTQENIKNQNKQQGKKRKSSQDGDKEPKTKKLKTK